MSERLCGMLVPSFLVAIALLGGSHAVAQSLEEELGACLRVEDEARRLACFEEVARRNQATAPAPGAPRSPAAEAAPSAAPVPSSGTAASGERAPQEDRFGLPEVRAPQSAEETRREMTLVEARRVGGGKGLYIMDNGQVWTLVTGNYRPVEAGTRVVIEEALFGSYRMIVGERGYRVRRIR